MGWMSFNFKAPLNHNFAVANRAYEGPLYSFGLRVWHYSKSTFVTFDFQLSCQPKLSFSRYWMHPTENAEMIAD